MTKVHKEIRASEDSKNAARAFVRAVEAEVGEIGGDTTASMSATAIQFLATAFNEANEKRGGQDTDASSFVKGVGAGLVAAYRGTPMMAVMASFFTGAQEAEVAITGWVVN